MDTINNLATAASKAIWGDSESHEEPVSGKMGNVAAGEPYDAGNIEPNEAALSSSEKEGPEAPTRTSIPQGTNKSATVPGTTAPIAPGTNAEPADDTTSPARGEAKLAPTAAKKSRDTGQHLSPAGPAQLAPSAVSMRDDSTKVQNDTRPPAPSPNTETMTTGTTDEATSTASSKRRGNTSEDKSPKKSDDDGNPDIKLEGPGPRPIEEVAREHGGDAGAAKPEGQAGAGVEEQQRQSRRDSGKSLGGDATDTSKMREGTRGEGGGGGQGSGMGGEPEREGNGDEYVKSSGFAAEGGDFDAAKAGAGREADRLLEEKGVHKGEAHGHGAEAGGGKEKVGLKGKIKAKLHKNVMSA